MASYLAYHLGLASPWQWLAYLGVALLQCGILMALVLTAAAMFTWMERKVSGRMQDRLGPTRVGGRFGWLQAVADGLKLITKEDLVPGEADAMLFRLAPYISFCASFAVYLALPFADGWVGQRLNTAVFFILAVAGLEVFGVILGGYASGSKYSLFGAMREAAQVVSYEVPLGLCAVVPVLVAGSMDLVTIGQMQQGWLSSWLIFHDPFTFLTFFVYLTCAVASVNLRHRSTWRRPRASWWPVSSRSIRASAGACSSWPSTPRWWPSAGWRRSSSSAAGTARCRSPSGSD